MFHDFKMQNANLVRQQTVLSYMVYKYKTKTNLQNSEWHIYTHPHSYLHILENQQFTQFYSHIPL